MRTRVLLCLLPVLLFGCASAGTVSSTPSNDPATVARTSQGIRLASALAVKAALISVDEQQAPTLAQTINQVAVALARDTARDDFQLSATRVLASTLIANSKLTTKQRVIASQLADTVALLVQDLINTQGVDLASDQRIVLARQYIKAACDGVIDGTAIWAAPPPTATTQVAEY